MASVRYFPKTTILISSVEKNNVVRYTFAGRVYRVVRTFRPDRVRETASDLPVHACVLSIVTTCPFRIRVRNVCVCVGGEKESRAFFTVTIDDDPMGSPLKLPPCYTTHNRGTRANHDTRS